eukprot:1245372-Pyramimonas_sp.AAC.2
MYASTQACLYSTRGKRLVPVPGISSRLCSDWFPSRVYPPVPALIGSRPGDVGERTCSCA